MNREYETIFIVRPNVTDETLKEVRDKVIGIIRGMGGTVIEIEEWGKRKLAYRVKKHTKGFYYLLHYAGVQALPLELERNLKIMEPVIRYLTVKRSDEIDVERLGISPEAPVRIVTKSEEDEVRGRDYDRRRGRYDSPKPASQLEYHPIRDREPGMSRRAAKAAQREKKAQQTAKEITQAEPQGGTPSTPEGKGAPSSETPAATPPTTSEKTSPQETTGKPPQETASAETKTTQNDETKPQAEA
ncbi:MAG: 30S ribosomal protein S6 [Deltaproteobacteria bacterium]|nr:MAG: 30S ribosomal protein S6 [Deltaproteobacteria bacterium]